MMVTTKTPYLSNLSLFYTFTTYTVLLLLILAATELRPCAAQQQKFRTTPNDLQVLERSEALLRCEVSNLAGQVQWTKDGFALGKCLLKFVCVFVSVRIGKDELGSS